MTQSQNYREREEPAVLVHSWDAQVLPRGGKGGGNYGLGEKKKKKKRKLKIKKNWPLSAGFSRSSGRMNEWKAVGESGRVWWWSRLRRLNPARWEVGGWSEAKRSADTGIHDGERAVTFGGWIAWERKREREREREREGGNGRLKARRRCYRCVPIYLCCLKKPSVFLGPSILILGNRAEEDRNWKVVISSCIHHASMKDFSTRWKMYETESSTRPPSGSSRLFLPHAQFLHQPHHCLKAFSGPAKVSHVPSAGYHPLPYQAKCLSMVSLPTP